MCEGLIAYIRLCQLYSLVTSTLLIARYSPNYIAQIGVDSGRRREQFCLWPCLSTHNAQIDRTESLSTQNTLSCSLMTSGVPLSRGREQHRAGAAVGTG